MPRTSRTMGVALLFLAAAGGCRKSEPQQLAIAAFMIEPGFNSARRVPEGGLITYPHPDVRFAGATTEPCHLIVLGLYRRLYPDRMDSERDDAPPVPVQPGEFRLRGNWKYDVGPGVLRVFAFCGGPDLRYDDLAPAVQRQAMAGLASGSVESALRRLDRIQGLPEGVAQATALFRLRP